jgi:hypothetical protein
MRWPEIRVSAATRNCWRIAPITRGETLMSQTDTPVVASKPARGPRRRWITPDIAQLPSLTHLTLQTGIPGDCEPGDPSSCF